MLPTTSTTTTSRRHKSHANRPSAVRKPSLLGTIKNIVTAPLAWFTNTDDFEQDVDTQGKRRRTATRAPELQPTELVKTADEGITPRIKRMRVDSPDRKAGYLDPPVTAFQQHNDNTNHNNPTPNRSASVSIPLPTVQGHFNFNNINTKRAPGISRTMSIDPPSSQPIHDASMSDMTRDVSLPPLSSRPSFRMRASLTPQPSQQFLSVALTPKRDVSEPPPISSLISNPVFVRGPPKIDKHPQSRADSVTLGSLVDSRRSSHSPVRSHSLLFSSSLTAKAPAQSTTSGNHATPSQKALQQLDIYKTPLVPTRLRAAASSSSSDISALLSGAPSGSSVPDLFRRKKVLPMTDRERDERRRDRANKDRDQQVNNTKPYAGVGGMKKLLARRRAEAAIEREAKNKHQDRDMEVETKKKHEVEVQTDLGDVSTSAPILTSTTSTVSASNEESWYTRANAGASKSSASSSTIGSSSLRVGRTKASRNHITRPSVPISSRTKGRFSAMYDDDAMDEGEEGEKGRDTVDVGENGVEHGIQDEEKRKERERKELEEAAKKVPVFNIPTSFSFAKGIPAPVLPADTVINKEPPIATLPFSFVKPSTPIPATDQETTEPALVPAPPAAPASLFNTPPLPPALPVKEKEATGSIGQAAKTGTIATGGAPGTASAIPNFFASSSAFSKPLVVSAPAPTLDFSPPPPNTTGSAQDAPTVAVPPSLPPTFSFPTIASIPTSSVASSTSTGASSTTTVVNGASDEVQAAIVKDSEVKSQLAPSQPVGAGEQLIPSAAQAPSLFSFGGSDTNGISVLGAATKEKEPTSVTSSSTSFGAAKSVGPSPFSFRTATDGPTVTAAPATTPFSFEKPTVADSSITSQSSAPTPSFLFGQPMPKEADKPASFSFGQPSTTTTSAIAGGTSIPSPVPETPKPFSLFGAGSAPADGQTKSLFSFGQLPSAEAGKPTATTTATTPFSFGAQPSTPPPGGDKKPAPFTFGSGATSTTPTSSGPFNFGSDTATGGSGTGMAFTFGTPTTLATGARPVTPPKEDQEVKMDESPTRDMQVNGAEARPNLGSLGGGFSFGSGSSGTGSGGGLFGSSGTGTGTSSPAPFSFGVSPNPFSTKPGEGEKAKPSLLFGTSGSGSAFGQSSTATSTTTPFSFGQPKADEAPRPNTTGSFSFGTNATPTSAGPSTSGTSPFSFGAPSTPSVPPSGSNTFGSGGSAPNSPSTFNVTPTFTFGTAPGTAAGTGGTPGMFTFGVSSQPASPAHGASALPGSSGAATGGFGGGFGANSTGGPTLFTMGAAPTPSPTAARQIRKLPTRRGGKR